MTAEDDASIWTIPSGACVIERGTMPCAQSLAWLPETAQSDPPDSSSEKHQTFSSTVEWIQGDPQ